MTDVTTLWARQRDAAPLIVLFHGRGSNEREIIGLAQHLPEDCAVVSLRGPIELGPGNYAWFQNQGIGRPIPASLRETMDWFTQWRSQQGEGRKVVLIGFSGGAAFVGGLALDDPSGYAGVAMLYGTVPFAAGVPTLPQRLAGVPVFHAQATNDDVMPKDLMARTWRYLNEESGATLEATLTNAGHALTEDALTKLAAWVQNLP